MASSWERAALSWSSYALPVLSEAAAGSRQPVLSRVLQHSHPGTGL